MGKAAPQAPSVRIITDQLEEAIAAPKCHGCGCLHQTVEALAGTEAGQGELALILMKARTALAPKRYDCLGCPVCYPANAANAFAAAWPAAGANLELCPTEEPEARAGWPPLPGDYTVVRYDAPVAVCTLNSAPLAQELVERRPEGLAIVGTLHTENLGIERLIHNTLANPYLRFLLLCGEDTQQAVGHLPGQSLESLYRNGLDEQGWIRGARGKRPVLKNVGRDEVAAFTQQVELVPMIGEDDAERVAGQIQACAQRSPGLDPHPFTAMPVPRVAVPEPQTLTLDRAGYFIVYPDVRSGRLALEHYTNQGVVTCVLEGASAGALYRAAIERQLVTRLDHAAYLGSELARAERALRAGEAYVQDKAPGEGAAAGATPAGCGCEPGTCEGR